jgi:hypothetical protein
VSPFLALRCAHLHPKLGPHGALPMVAQTLLFHKGLKFSTWTTSFCFGIVSFRARVPASIWTAVNCMGVDVPYELEGLLGVQQVASIGDIACL